MVHATHTAQDDPPMAPLPSASRPTWFETLVFSTPLAGSFSSNPSPKSLFCSRKDGCHITATRNLAGAPAGWQQARYRRRRRWKACLGRPARGLIRRNRFTSLIVAAIDGVTDSMRGEIQGRSRRAAIWVIRSRSAIASSTSASLAETSLPSIGSRAPAASGIGDETASFHEHAMTSAMKGMGEMRRLVLPAASRRTNISNRGTVTRRPSGRVVATGVLAIAITVSRNGRGGKP